MRILKQSDDIKVVLEYGMLTEDRFFDRVKDFVLFPTINKEYFTLEEFREKVKDAQTDKDDNLVLLILLIKKSSTVILRSNRVRI